MQIKTEEERQRGGGGGGGGGGGVPGVSETPKIFGLQ